MKVPELVYFCSALIELPETAAAEPFSCFHRGLKLEVSLKQKSTTESTVFFIIHWKWSQTTCNLKTDWFQNFSDHQNHLEA